MEGGIGGELDQTGGSPVRRDAEDLRVRGHDHGYGIAREHGWSDRKGVLTHSRSGDRDIRGLPDGGAVGIDDCSEGQQGSGRAVGAGRSRGTLRAWKAWKALKSLDAWWP